MTLTRFAASFGSLSVLFCVLCSACSDGEESPSETMTDAGANAVETAPPSSRPPTDVVDAAVRDAPPDAPFDYCTAQGARYAECFPTATFDPAQCKKDEACLRSIYHPDVNIEGYLRCRSAGCLGGGTSCLGYLSGHDEDPAFKEFLAACKTRLDACGDLGPKQFTDGCSPFAVMGVRDDVLAERATCLTVTCTEIADCMNEKVVVRCGL